jgi:tellurite resistance protein
MTGRPTAPAAGAVEAVAGAPPAGGPSLAHLPVTLFSTVMGLGGVSLAWRRAAHVWDVPDWPALVFLGLATAAFVVVALAYTAKWVRYPAAARAELRHPIRMTFVPTITISLLVLATAGQDVAPGLASVLWWVGAVGHLVATVAIVSAWFGRADIVHSTVTPAWFIPVVGNVVTPLAARELGSVEFAWFAFGIGLVFWLGLLPLLLQRVLVHDAALPGRLLPTIAIFIAPPAVAMLSWAALTGDAGDPVARVLWAAAMGFVLVLVAQAGRLRAVPFALPYWAYTFPLAAASAAAVAMAGVRPQVGYDVIAVTLLTGTTLLVLHVLTLTLRAAARRQICLPE